MGSALKVLVLFVILLMQPFSTLKGTAAEPSLFGVGKVKIDVHILNVEVAESDKARERGLMERSSLSDTQGMLFVFKDEKVRHFWMKNTYIPLSIGFFDKNKTLVDIQDMEPMNSPMDQKVSRYTSIKPAMYALEVNRGWFKQKNIKILKNTDMNYTF